MTNRLLYPREVAEQLGLKLSTLRALSKKGLIETVRPTLTQKHFRYTQEAVDEFIRSRTVKAIGSDSPPIEKPTQPILRVRDHNKVTSNCTFPSLDQYEHLKSSGIAERVAKKIAARKRAQ